MCFHLKKVTIALEGSRLTMTLNGRPLNVPVNKENIDLMYFYRLFVGGFDVFDRIPWAIYSRQGYKGCLESLKINDIGKQYCLRLVSNNV
jgi:hypothetical protein